jgi:D-alanyl-D-alanine carboxypeptidase
MKLKMISKLWKQLRFVLLIVLVLIGIALNIYAATQFTKHEFSISQPTPNIERELKAQPTPTTTPTTPVSSKAVSPGTTDDKTLLGKSNLGHFPFVEGNSSEMLTIASYGPGEYQRFEKLAPEAALALMKLIYAARYEGVWIVPVSGFRNIADQEKLFEVQIQKLGSPEAAAKLSAPPGYSEHHTGYAIDLADGHFPKQDITYNFATTDTFKWLNLHAKEFGFELSFPENNAQGVSYEPWHWCFVGSPEAQVIFRNKVSK